MVLAVGGASPERPGARQQLFARQVVANAAYWRTRLERHAAELATLDVENENLARAIWLGLGSPDTRQASFELIAAARDFILRRGGAEAWGDLLTSAARMAAGSPPSRDTVVVLAAAAEVYAYGSAGSGAERLYRIALRQCRRLPEYPDLQAQMLVDLGWLLLTLNKHARGSAYLQQARDLAERHGYPLVLARALLGLGVGHNARGESQAALSCLSEALRLAQDLQESNHIGRAHYELGVVYWRAGDIERARSHAEQAADWLQRSGDISLASNSANLLGVLCFERDEFEQATRHFLDAETNLIRTGHARELASLHNNLGAAFWGLQRWAEAERYFSMAREEHHTHGTRLRAAEASINLGECLLDQEKWQAAAAALSDARGDLDPDDASAFQVRLLERLDGLEDRLAASVPPEREAAQSRPPQSD